MALKVATCMIIYYHKILLINRNKEPYMGWWAFPGGKIEIGETTKDAAIREIFEETGFDVDPSLYCNLLEDLIENGEIINQFDLNYHVSKLQSPEKIIQNNEGELKWFDLSEIPQDMVPSDKKVLELYLINNPPINASCDLERKPISTNEKKNFVYDLVSWNHSNIS